MTNKHMKRWSIALVIRKMTIKTTVRYYYTPTRMAIIKRIDNSVDQNMEKLDLSYIADGNIRWYSHSEKLIISFIKTVIYNNPAIPLPSIYQREIKALCPNTYTQIFIAAFLIGKN